jgi:hypothetical protein
MAHPTMHMEEELSEHIVALGFCILICPQKVAKYDPNPTGLPNLHSQLIAENCCSMHLGVNPHFHQVNKQLPVLQQAEHM